MSGSSAETGIDTMGETDIPRTEFTFSRFADEYNLHAAFLPFEKRVREDRIEDLTEVTEFLTTRPPYCQGTSMRHLTGRRCLDDSLNRCVGDDIELLALFHGWWVTDHSGNSGRQFANPGYTHRDSQNYVTDREKREEIARRAASLGYVTPAQVGIIFGFSPEMNPDATFRVECQRMGVPWGELRAAGRETMARTWKTIWSWGYSQREVAAAFDVSQSVVNRAIQRVEDYDPPSEPTKGGAE